MIIIDCLTTSSWVMISTFILKDGEHFHVIIHVMFDDREYCPRKFSCQRFPPYLITLSVACMLGDVVVKNIKKLCLMAIVAGRNNNNINSLVERSVDLADVIVAFHTRRGSF